MIQYRYSATAHASHDTAVLVGRACPKILCFNERPPKGMQALLAIALTTALVATTGGDPGAHAHVKRTRAGSGFTPHTNTPCTLQPHTRYGIAGPSFPHRRKLRSPMPTSPPSRSPPQRFGHDEARGRRAADNEYQTGNASRDTKRHRPPAPWPLLATARATKCNGADTAARRLTRRSRTGKRTSAMTHTRASPSPRPPHAVAD